MIYQNNRNFVRLTHTPTGISVVCGEHRSQHKNRDACWHRLRALLYAQQEGIAPSYETLRVYEIPDDASMYVEDLNVYVKEKDDTKN